MCVSSCPPGVCSVSCCSENMLLIPSSTLLSCSLPHQHLISQCGYSVSFSLNQSSHCSTCLLWFSLLSCLFCGSAWLPMCSHFCLLNFVSRSSALVSCLQSAFSSSCLTVDGDGFKPYLLQVVLRDNFSQFFNELKHICSGFWGLVLLVIDLW